MPQDNEIEKTMEIDENDGLDNESRIACIISTKGVLTKYHIDDSLYLARELMPYIRAICAKSYKEGEEAGFKKRCKETVDTVQKWKKQFLPGGEG